MPDYRPTVLLPETSFGMRANLQTLEPELVAVWEKEDLYGTLEKMGEGRPLFILHDGPPYANGHLHLGHVLNKTLKDIVCKHRRMAGFHVPFIPGWDCHGLPIEVKVEEAFKKQGRRKEDVSKPEFLAACQAFAENWIEIQKKEFARLGVLADWAHPYTTMSPDAEGTIVGALHQLLQEGYVVQGLKPVLWSVAEQTALADTEVEYHDHTSTFLYVAFPIVQTEVPLLLETGAKCVIWTTTPWSLPGNRAIAYGADITYAVVGTPAGAHYVVAESLVPAFIAATGLEGAEIVGTLPGTALAGTIARHPLFNDGYTFPVPLLAGDHVAEDAGTGLVHTAPSHGVEDFVLGKAHGLEVPTPVGGDGVYVRDVPLFAGQHIFKATPAIVAALQAADALVKEGKLTHSYPHSWRSKTPLIYRATHQWFLSMAHNQLRDVALKAIDEVTWLPASGRNRIYSMIENRPDWCLSRQRLWGVPLAIFTNKHTGEPLKDPEVLGRTAALIRENGIRVWWESPPERFLGGAYDPAEWLPVQDTLDVWFESGMAHEYVLKKDPYNRWPADLYLEGSDQHRGWFHTSLLTGAALEGHAPYKAVMTHGYVVDEKGYKFSKSLGNGIDFDAALRDYGADILRLWVVGIDYFEDGRVGPEILKHQQDIYRRIRNTFRFLLGNLHDFDAAKNAIPREKLPLLGHFMLARMAALDDLRRQTLETYDFHTFYTELHQFCTNELSAFYFDIRKDVLYCEAPDSFRRRAAQTILHNAFMCLVTWFAPVLSFTAEEVWRARFGDTKGSIHAQPCHEIPAAWKDVDQAKWERLRTMRRVVTGALEQARAAGQLGSSLEAAVTVYGPALWVNATENFPLPEFFIVSVAEAVEGAVPAGAFTLPEAPEVGVVVRPAPGHKCERCWRVLEEVGEDATYADLCQRCLPVVVAAGIEG